MKRVLTFLLLAGCNVTDLNRPCTLVVAGPDGGLRLTKLDLALRNAINADIISFGSSECEEQKCVRDSAFTDDLVDTSPEAKGYCSAPCSPGSDDGCASADPRLDASPSTKLHCRALLLDPATLAALRAKDPERYKRTFGMTTTPFFCARGGP
jgi:hypothetical protein